MTYKNNIIHSVSNSCRISSKKLKLISFLTVAALTSLILSGCGSIPNQTPIDVAAMLRVNNTQSSARSLPDTTVWGGLDAIAPSGPRDLPSLPKPLADSTLVKKLVQANLTTVHSTTSARSIEQEPSPKPVSFGRSDFTSFIKETMPAIGVQAWDSTQENLQNTEKTGAARGLAGDAGKTLEKYLVIYYQGNFVDHQGNAISKPSVSGGKIGDDTIIGFATVVMESLNDTFYRVPIFYQKKAAGDTTPTWLTPTGKEPTFAALAATGNSAVNMGFDSTKVQLVSDQTQPTQPMDITKVQAMQFLASVASDQSKALSALVFKSFGGATASFVIGGKLSIGDNQTLSQLVDSFFEVNTYRTTEALAYSYLKTHDENDSGAGMQDLLQLVKETYAIYKDYKAN